ncbi:MAG: IS21 family transposase [Anaerolineae bacterium]|nr:IS21 family transposase [Anaerolineae bacterium]
MISVEDREQIRRAYFSEEKSQREIARELGHSRKTVRKAIESAEPEGYRLRKPRAAPVLGPYRVRIDELLEENERLPRKQRYTGHRIYRDIQGRGYSGAESTVRGYIARRRREKKKPQVYIPLEFDPGTDAQVDWGEAVASVGGERVTVQVFVMRLCYSRKLFVRAYPRQKQEAFFDGHVGAFHHFEGIPRCIAYDNLKAAVLRVLEGRNRQEQDRFVVFRSHYLFDSRFCTPGQGHEKGRVEDGVGFSRRNFMVPIPRVASFEELNEHLLSCCQADDQRRVDRQKMTIGEAWEMEKPHLWPLPERDFDCCVTRAVSLNPYGQVEFETNRYSVPSDEASRNPVLKAYPFRIDVLYGNDVIASHPRCYDRKQDILDPFHYLPLLEQRPGAFDHAKPIRGWREGWPPVYEELLARLRAQWPDGRGVREFIRILKLHRDHADDLVAQAVEQALGHGCAHADGVELCLRQLEDPGTPIAPMDLTRWPELMAVDGQSPDLQCYDRLLERV